MASIAYAKLYSSLEISELLLCKRHIQSIPFNISTFSRSAVILHSAINITPETKMNFFFFVNRMSQTSTNIINVDVEKRKASEKEKEPFKCTFAYHPHGVYGVYGECDSYASTLFLFLRIFFFASLFFLFRFVIIKSYTITHVRVKHKIHSEPPYA